MKNTRTTDRYYSELIKMNSFDDRFNYLLLNGCVGGETFGGHRSLNQALYRSQEWRKLRREIIYRDNACDLAHPDYPIQGKVYIHHLNTLSINDILERKPKLFDMENLVCVSFETHNALHYGCLESIPRRDYQARIPDDTCPWR